MWFNYVSDTLNNKEAIITNDLGEDVKVTIRFCSVSIAVEGISLLEILPMDCLCDQACLIWDIGSSTTDIVQLEYVEETESFVIVEAWSLPFGGAELCADIAKKLYELPEKIVVSEEKLERKQAYTWKGIKHSILEHAEFADNYVEKVLTGIKRSESIEQFKVVLAGGAAEVVSNCPRLKEKVPFSSVVPSALATYGNSRGSLLS